MHVCVVQGNVRTNTDVVLSHMNKIFDKVVFSTWSDEKTFPVGSYELVLSERPPNPGLNNRNYQRKTTCVGVQMAAQLGADFVMKWRSDMLPTTLDISELERKSRSSVCPIWSGRIVIPAFRTLTVHPDVFSSIPDLFAFGPIDAMLDLWDDSDFDYSANFNFGESLAKFSDIPINGLVPPEVELYFKLKSLLSRRYRCDYSHEDSIRNLFVLIDHLRLGIVWFSDHGIRPINTAAQFPWWTEQQWKNKRKARVMLPGYPDIGLAKTIRKVKARIILKKELLLQSIWWNKYKKNMKVNI